MKISLNWISDYVNLDGIDPKELALKLTMSTAEVEEVIIMGKEIQNVVVGKVTGVEPHPTSEKLKIVQVDIGTDTVQTVCGAPNVAQGITAPFAGIGGSILNLPKIEKTSLAGVESNGILCSGAELGLNNSADKLLILDPLINENVKPGTDLKDLFGIDDIIIEIDNKSLTHRPDLWGHYGIAREIAAILKRPLGKVERKEVPHNPNLPDNKIEILDDKKCFRYSCISVEEVGAVETPLDLQIRITYCGMNTRSLLVDLSNYIMMEIAQPTHAFDNRFAQNIVVKCPDKAFKFWTLDGVERDITPDVLMIYDDETPVAVAGVIGGEESEIVEDTQTLLLESANFDAFTVRKGATKIGARTDASARFEKSLDPELTTLAIKRFLYLLEQVKPDMKITSNLSDLYVKKFDPITITLDKSYLDRYIGKDLSVETITGILESLEFKVERDGDTFTALVPPFRATRDISLKVDLVEEVTRIYGYDNIEPQTVEVPLKPLVYNENRLMGHKVKEILAEKFGFTEVHSYTWYDSDFNKRLEIPQESQIKLLNSQDKEATGLRTNIVPMMLQFAERNVNQFPLIPLFEIGKVFYLNKETKQCDERKNICMMLADKNRSEDQLFYNLKGITTYLLKLLKGIEPTYAPLSETLNFPWSHPEKSATVSLGDKEVGYLTALHPTVKRNLDKKLNVIFLEIDFTSIFEAETWPVKYRQLSKYPEVSLDFSFLSDHSTPYHQMDGHVSAFKHPLLLGYEYVTMYDGKNLPEGKKSLTFSFTLGSKEKTLLSEDIDKFLNQLIAHMEKEGFTLRRG